MTEKRKKDIRLVVSDIDGTLIRRGEGFPKEVEQAAAELKKRGILFTFASGRLPYMITPFAEGGEACKGACRSKQLCSFFLFHVISAFPGLLTDPKPHFSPVLFRDNERMPHTNP